MIHRSRRREIGTVALESSKILKAGEGDKLEDINSSYSVFNQFRFYRGQDYYDGTSKNVQFVYDTTQGDYGAKSAIINIYMPYITIQATKITIKLILALILAPI